MGGNCGEKYKYHVLAAAVFGGFYFLFLAGVVVGGATTKIEANGTPGGRTGGEASQVFTAKNQLTCICTFTVYNLKKNLWRENLKTHNLLVTRVKKYFRH